MELNCRGLKHPAGVPRWRRSLSGVNGGDRCAEITETITGTNFSTNFTFDNLGRLSTRTHPSGIVETNNYNGNGYLDSISAGGATRFTVTAMNERQQLTAATYGTNLTGDFGYNSYGYPTHSKAHVSGTYRQDYRYEFNSVTGNLNWRKNHLRNLTESFTYDDLDRLLTVTGPQNLTMNYADNGNITGKSDLGTANQFIYNNSASPYRLTGLEIDSALQIVPVTLQQLAYTSFEQPSVITESPYQATFAYNTEGQRASMVVTQNGSTILTRSYVGSRYIKDSNGNEYTWIGGDAYTAPCVVAKTGGTTNWYYVLREHLGTITHVTNDNGTVLNEYSFDAWGRRRNFSNWGYTVAAQTDLLPARGFTAHEWLPWFNLYNMNGRLGVYPDESNEIGNPVVGRFLSPDNYVQMPDFSQNFNRYSYCINNPLKYSDKNGEWFGIDDAIAFVIGGAVNLTVNLIQGNIDNIGEGLAAFGAGGAAGTLALYGPAGWAAGGAIVGGTNAWVSGAQGWDILQGAGIGVFSGLAGGAVGQWAAQGLGNVVVQGLNITSPVLKGVIGGTIGGAAGGYAGGFTGGLLTTGDLSAAHQAGMSGMITGAPIGGVAGGIGGYAYAKSNDINPWTGKYNKSIVIGRQMESRVNPAAGDLGAETITNAWNEQFGEGVRVSDSKGIQFNRRWYSGKLNDGYHVYDIGSGGLPSGKYYGAELSLSKGYWNVSKTNYWSFFDNNIRIIYYGK